MATATPTTNTGLTAATSKITSGWGLFIASLAGYVFAGGRAGKPIAYFLGAGVVYQAIKLAGQSAGNASAVAAPASGSTSGPVTAPESGATGSPFATANQ
jgi:hypothetical protein